MPEANDLAWYERPEIKNLYIKAASKAMRGYHAPISSPKTVFTGTNGLIDFTNHVRAFLQDGEKRALIVVDKDLRKYGEQVASQLSSITGFESRIFDNVQPDVPKPTVMEGVKACEEFDPKLIIAVGGGSAMDTAKCIFLLYEKPGLDLNMLMAPSYLGLRQKVRALVAIPTTSGTGSETTFVAVITDTDRSPPKKTEVVLYEIVPDFAVLHVDFVKSMPPKLTMGTGMDALAHAMGAYMLTMSNEFTDMCNAKAVAMILEWLPRSVTRGDDLEAREKMQLASYIAGLGFGNVSGGLEHALGHAFGALFHVHHGVCVGMFLPGAIAYQAKVTNRFMKLATIFGVEPRGKTREAMLRELLESLLAFMKSVGCPSSISELEGPAISMAEYTGQMEKMVDFAYNDYCTLSASRKIDPPQYAKIFEVAWKNDLEGLMGLFKM